MFGKEKPPGGATTEGQPETVEANGITPIAHNRPKGNTRYRELAQANSVAFRASNGVLWHYKGKRARVLAMLATMPNGLTQWDTLPWHTRLGGTIHAMRRDGLGIDTQREGRYRHARYRLTTLGKLVRASGRKGGAS